MKFLSTILFLIGTMFLTFIPRSGYAQDFATEKEEISIGFSVPGVGSMTLPAYIDLENRLFLPVAEIFAYLRIKVDTTSDGLRINGFLIDEKKNYRINALERTVDFAGKHYDLDSTQMLITEGRIYLQSDLYGAIFALNCTFNFRDLEVGLSTEIELPAVRDAKRENARHAMRTLINDESFDKGVSGGREFLRLGVADWTTSGEIDSLGHSRINYAFDFGGEVFGGAFQVRLQGENDSIGGFSSIPWQWRYVDNDFAPARQITVGKVSSMLPEPFSGSALGASITNRSTISRTSYGSYRIQDRTEPGWDVELYIDDQLVDFTTADENGLYHFEIPFRYGSTAVTLRFFGPWGEEETLEKTLRIPVTMLPAGEVEYTVATGLLDGEGSGLFAHAKGEIGVNSMLTVGGGMYGLQYNAPESWYPYLTGTVRLTNALLFSGKYSPSTGGEGRLNWIISKQSTVELGYQRAPRFVEGEATGMVDKRSLSISTPMPLGGTAQFRLVDNLTSFGHDLQGDGAIATRVLGFPLTLEFRGEWFGSSTLRAASMRAGVRTMLRPFGFVNIRPSLDIDLNAAKIGVGRIELERQLFRGFWATATVVYDFGSMTTYGQTSAQFGLRLDLPFTRTNTTARYQNGGVSFSTSASGSIAYDSKNGIAVAGNRSAMDRASLTIRPFLDLNGNDVRDAGEPLVPQAEVSIAGGTVRHSSSDSTLRVLGLEPYRPRIMTVDEASLPEISWKPKYKTWKVTPQPNRFQTIDVPIVVVGEISGTVVRGEKGMRGLIVRFRQLDGTFSDSTITYEGGEFFYMGLPPGHYSASLDQQQMNILGMTPEITTVEFDVKAGKEGDVIEGMNLKIK